MSITVIKPGILDTLQDIGRFGHQLLGVNPGGAMDRFSMQVANALVGNRPAEAVVEMHFPAPVLLFHDRALLALSGADFSAHINGEPVPVNQPLLAGKNDVLHFSQPRKGARAYLAVRGGLVAEEWMKSCSTHLKLGAGGYKGRKLKKDDRIELKRELPEQELSSPVSVLPWKAGDWVSGEENVIRVLYGHEWETLTRNSRENFFMTDFVVTRQSDRMGYRLSNTPLHRTTKEEVISSAVGFGTIQLLPDGGLIILMADHQTTGGYPRVAHVIAADHGKLAQHKAGDRIRFRAVHQPEAEALYVQQEQHLLQLQNACTFRLQEYFGK